LPGIVPVSRSERFETCSSGEWQISSICVRVQSDRQGLGGVEPALIWWKANELIETQNRPLREAIAEYLRTSRGVKCTAEQIVLVSGIQQALDLLARLLLKWSDPIWLEDPDISEPE
jgi:hypothetical protein